MKINYLINSKWKITDGFCKKTLKIKGKQDIKTQCNGSNSNQYFHLIETLHIYHIILYIQSLFQLCISHNFYRIIIN